MNTAASGRRPFVSLSRTTCEWPFTPSTEEVRDADWVCRGVSVRAKEGGRGGEFADGSRIRKVQVRNRDAHRFIFILHAELREVEVVVVGRELAE